MRLPLFAALLGATLLVGAPAAFADAEYDDCVARPDATMMDFGDCGGAWIEREDMRLNAAWRRLTAALEGDDFAGAREALRVEQRAWLAFRDASCQVFLDEMQFGQNGRYLSYPVCRAELIAARTAELDGLRGDLSEPQ